MSPHTILVVDDEAENLSSTSILLKRWLYSVKTAASADEALDLVNKMGSDFAVALLDYRMPQQTGVELAKTIRAIHPEIICVIYSAYPSVESLKGSFQAGAINFIDKNDELVILRNGLEAACKEHDRVRTLRRPLSSTEIEEKCKLAGMVGRSQGIGNVADRALRYSEVAENVLIRGETGSGKEQVARALHGNRRGKFCTVNCGNIKENLMESEMFGHEKGAFTGAFTRQIGMFEMAKGGTIFLDEVHLLSQENQGGLLRALREKKIRRVGGREEEEFDYRVVAASKADIEERVNNRTFLPDLYYRLTHLTIEIPPLRDRLEDIEPLVHEYCDRYFKKNGRRKKLLGRFLNLAKSGS